MLCKYGSLTIIKAVDLFEEMRDIVNIVVIYQVIGECCRSCMRADTVFNYFLKIKLPILSLFSSSNGEHVIEIGWEA